MKVSQEYEKALVSPEFKKALADSRPWDKDDVLHAEITRILKGYIHDKKVLDLLDELIIDYGNARIDYYNFA